MKFYKPDGRGLSTLEVSLQDGEYKGSFTYQIWSDDYKDNGGDLSLFDLDALGLIQKLMDYQGIDNEVELYDVDGISIELKNEKGNSREITIEVEEDFLQYFVGIRIIDWKSAETKSL